MDSISRLAVITNYWKHSNGGGIRIYVVNLVEQLTQNEIAVTVISKKGKDSEQIIIDKNKWRFVADTFFTLTRLKPVIIHTHANWYCLLPACLYKLFFKTRLVHTFHSIPEQPFKPPSRYFLQQLVYRCDCVTFVSKALKKYLMESENLGFNATAITYAGINETEAARAHKEGFRKTFGLPEHTVIILAHSLTSHSQKAEGAKLLISCLKDLKKDFKALVLVLTKEGHYIDELKKYAMLNGVAEAVIFTGNLENTNFATAACDIYAQVTLAEGGISLGLLEAMAMGKPVIASNTGGIPELVTDKETGLLVNFSAAEITGKIKQLLLQREEAVLMGERARLHVEEHFNWQKTVSTLLEVYGTDKKPPLSFIPAGETSFAGNGYPAA